MATKSTHTECYFMRSCWVRREHIRGDSDDGTNGLMRIVERGQKHSIIAPQATHLIVDETCLEVKSTNADAIAADRAALETDAMAKLMSEEEAGKAPQKTRRAA